MMKLRPLFTALACLWGVTSSADNAELVAMEDLPRVELTAELISQRCSGFYKAMNTRSLETGISPEILDLVVSSGQRAESYALSLSSADRATDVLDNIANYEVAYLRNFRETETQVNMIQSPNRLFASDRATCFNGFGP